MWNFPNFRLKCFFFPPKKIVQEPATDLLNLTLKEFWEGKNKGWWLQVYSRQTHGLVKRIFWNVPEKFKEGFPLNNSLAFTWRYVFQICAKWEYV